MSGRVLLSSSAIRVSKPGIEVTTAGVSDLLLDISMVQGQFLAHGYMPLNPSSSSNANFGPWSGSVAIGPFSSVPDVILGFVFAGGKSTSPPVQRFNSGAGFRAWSVTGYTISQNNLAVTVGPQPATVDNVTPQALLGLNYLIFRRRQI